MPLLLSKLGTYLSYSLMRKNSTTPLSYILSSSVCVCLCLSLLHHSHCLTWLKIFYFQSASLDSISPFSNHFIFAILYHNKIIQGSLTFHWNGPLSMSPMSHNLKKNIWPNIDFSKLIVKKSIERWQCIFLLAALGT